MELVSMILIGIQGLTLAVLAGCIVMLKKQIRTSTEEVATQISESDRESAEQLERVVNEIKDHFEIHLNNIAHDTDALRTATATIAEDFAKLRTLQEFSVSELTTGNTRIQDTLSDGLRKQQQQIQDLGITTQQRFEQFSEQQRQQIQEDLTEQTEGLLKLADSSQRMLSTIISHFNQLSSETATLKKATAALVNNQKQLTSSVVASRQSVTSLQTVVEQQLLASQGQDDLVTRVDQLRRSIEADLHGLSSRIDQHLQTLMQRQTDKSSVTREDITGQKIAIEDVREQVDNITGELNSLAEALLEALSAQGELLAVSIDQSQTTLYTELDSVRQEQQRLNELSDDLRRLVQLLRVHNQNTLSLDDSRPQLEVVTGNSRQYFSHGKLERSDDLMTGDSTHYYYEDDQKHRADTLNKQGLLKYRSLFDEQGQLTISSEFDPEGKETYRYHFDESGSLTEKVQINYDANGMQLREVSEVTG